MEEISTNPFDVESDSSLDILEIETKHQKTKKHISFDEIAQRLINDKFYLTALELHMELIEAGTEMPRLKDFFSNPSNFEKCRHLEPKGPTNLIRTSSIQTFDSLDFARYSDDGEHNENERVAVLEFELRKAHEKITSLRSALTKASENELSSIKNSINDCLVIDEQDVITTVEKRAINFLLNEYLLENDYKISSVTFSEENDGQDFEDWDDVGLNTSKPNGILYLYRNFSLNANINSCNPVCVDVFTSTEEEVIMSSSFSNFNEELNRKISELKTEIEIKIKENVSLEKDISSLNETIVELKRNVLNNNEKIDTVRNQATMTIINEQDIPYTNTNTISVSHSNIGILNSFQSTLVLYNKHLVLGDNLLSLQMYEVLNDKDNGVVKLLGNCLPNVLPNVLLSKRDTLIPLLVCASILHPSQEKRDSLLHDVFNLIKKPDLDQRRIILAGCVAFAQEVSQERIESEMLPQCWEQIGHKLVERRLLVAEACSILAPYLAPGLCSSLVLSMLMQMATDKEDIIREAVVKCTATIVAFVEDSSKYRFVLELLMDAINHTSESVVCSACNILLPAVAKWSLNLNCLEEKLITPFLDLLELFLKPTATSFLIVDPKRFILLFDVLNKLLPFLFISLVSSCPKIDLAENIMDKTLQHIANFPKYDSDFFLLQKISDDFDVFKTNLANYFSYTDQDHYELWPECDWLFSKLIAKIISLSNKLDSSQLLIIKPIINFNYNLCQMLGKKFVSSQIVIRFEKILKIPEDENSLDKSLLLGQSPLNKCTIAIYCASVLSSVGDLESIELFLQKIIHSIALHQADIGGLEMAFEPLCLRGELYQDIILKVLWEKLMDTSISVRKTVSQLFKCIVKCNLSQSVFTTRIMPALVTLSNDVDLEVRVTTLSALGIVVEFFSDSAILDKVYMEFKSFSEEKELITNYQIVIQFIKILGKIGPCVDASFRENFILLQLHLFASRNQQRSMSDSFKVETALCLFDAFAAVSCCFIGLKALQNSMLPGLKCLLFDLEVTAPDRSKITLSMIKEVEDKIRQRNDNHETINNADHFLKEPETNNINKNLEGSTLSVHNSDIKINLMGKLKDVRELATHSNLTKIFAPKK